MKGYVLYAFFMKEYGFAACAAVEIVDIAKFLMKKIWYIIQIPQKFTKVLAIAFPLYYNTEKYFSVR